MWTIRFFIVNNIKSSNCGGGDGGTGGSVSFKGGNFL